MEGHKQAMEGHHPATHPVAMGLSIIIGVGHRYLSFLEKVADMIYPIIAQSASRVSSVNCVVSTEEVMGLVN